MGVVILQVKWGKESFELKYDPSTGYSGLCQDLQAKTNVPVSRMKLMAKSKGLWKGVLKEDSFATVDWNAASNNASVPLNVLLMGSADKLAAPAQKPVFLEDLPPEEIAKVVEPSGLVNLGNTCYLNSVVQCLRAVPSFRKGIAANTTNGGSSGNEVHKMLLQTLQETVEQLDRQSTALQPRALVYATKTCFPQFATTGAHGQPQQQDAEEFYSALLTVAASETKSSRHLQAALPTALAQDFMGASNVADAVFGIQMKETLTCDEVPDGQEPVVETFDLHRKLVCNIQGGANGSTGTTNVTHISEGITLALSEGGIEKHSNVLGRNAAWTRTQRIARLPPCLTVQFGRFYWKATPDSQDHAGVKCKIMKPVSFQPTLDVFAWCTPEIQAVLQKSRSAAAAAEEDRVTKKLKGMSEEEVGNNAQKKGDAVPMETDAVAVAVGERDGDDDDEEAKALQAALAMSMDDTTTPTVNEDNTTASTKPVSIGPGLPKDFQGIYELFAVVTHKGRDADGGHYMAWVKAAHQPAVVPKIGDTGVDNEDWFVFDDDEVSPCKTEDILKLSGGGDWHTSYLNFYRAKK